MVSFVIGKEIEKYVFRLVTSVGQRKYSDEKHLSHFFTELKTFHLSHSDAIGIADPSSMQDACNTNFVIDLADRRVSLAQW